MTLKMQEEIRKLQTYSNVSFSVISVYLKITENGNLVKQFRELTSTFSTQQNKDLKRDIEYIEAFLKQYKVKDAKSVAIFSGGDKLWEVLTTDFELASLLVINHSPYLSPLQNGLQKYKRYLVVLTDREKVIMFTLVNGVVEAHKEIFDDSVSLHKHLKLLSHNVGEFVYGKPVAGVLIGGHRELFHRSEECLPAYLQEKIIGEFVSELNVPINDIFEKSKHILQQSSHIAIH